MSDKRAQPAQTDIRTSEKIDDLPFYVYSYLTDLAEKRSGRTAHQYQERLMTFYRYLVYEKRVGERMDEITLEDLGKLTPDDIVAYAAWLRRGQGVNGQGLKESSINNYLSAVSSFYTYFAKQRKLLYNPVSLVDREHVAKETVPRMDRKQQSEYLSGVESGEFLTDRQLKFHGMNASRDLAICALLMHTDLKVSELVGIDLNDVDLANGTILILQSRKRYRTVQLDRKVIDAIEKYLPDRRSVLDDDAQLALFITTFGQHKGHRLTVRSVERLVKKYASTEALSIEGAVTPERLRKN